MASGIPQNSLAPILLGCIFGLNLVVYALMEVVNSFLSQYKIPLALTFVGLVLIIGGIFSSGINQKTTQATSFPAKSIVKPSEINQIKVDVSGAVNKPGVYSLNLNSRIEDVIKAAGGFSQKVNQEFISKSLNLSQKISDGQKIYVPFTGEAGIILGSQAGGALSSRIGINSATIDQLNSLPGVGSVTSQKIISARPFNAVEDLISKKAVSRSVFDKIKDQIDLN